MPEAEGGDKAEHPTEAGRVAVQAEGTPLWWLWRRRGVTGRRRRFWYSQRVLRRMDSRRVTSDLQMTLWLIARDPSSRQGPASR